MGGWNFISFRVCIICFCKKSQVEKKILIKIQKLTTGEV